MPDISAIGPSTRVSLGAVGAVFVAVVSSGWFLSAKLTQIESRIASLESRHDDFPIRQMTENISDQNARLRWIEAFISNVEAIHLKTSDMETWIQQARTRSSFSDLPDLPKH